MMGAVVRRTVAAGVIAVAWVWTASAFAQVTPPQHPAVQGLDLGTLFAGSGGQAILFVLLWTEQRKQRDKIDALTRALSSRPCVRHRTNECVIETLQED